MFILDDTIAALASAPGAAGRGIIRCSGPQVLSVLGDRFQPDNVESWASRSTAQRHPGIWTLGIGDRRDNSPSSVPLRIRMDVYLWPNRRSYTGQPQAELHTLSSPPLLEAVLGDLFSAGARPAQAGEFTLRAFLAGRMDLLQAEAVLGVIDASDSRSLQVALTQLAGGVSQRLTLMRTELVDLLADLEAGLDFTEEGIEFVSRAVLVDRISAARDELQILLERSTSHARHATRPRVVLAGLPNAGKSSLFNALIGSQAALVSPVAGTTRDYLTAPVQWQGATWDLIDTAGRESSEDAILKTAQELRLHQIEQADLVLECVPVSDWIRCNSTVEPIGKLDEAHAANAGGAQFTPSDPELPPGVLQVITKCDLDPSAIDRKDGAEVRVSAQTGAGLQVLLTIIAQALALRNASESGILGSTLARCRDSLERATSALSRAAEIAESGGGDEFLATDVREALDELGSMTGAFYTDDLLDRIFSKFCIGK
ncbi:MAG: mnmE 1 [Planctomycetaceae bacterium]|nr:mnmE 1 [Planctomycetaceae bacterium]